MQRLIFSLILHHVDQFYNNKKLVKSLLPRPCGTFLNQAGTSLNSKCTLPSSDSHGKSGKIPTVPKCFPWPVASSTKNSSKYCCLFACCIIFTIFPAWLRRRQTMCGEGIIKNDRINMNVQNTLLCWLEAIMRHFSNAPQGVPVSSGSFQFSKYLNKIALIDTGSDGDFSWTLFFKMGEF